jgi:hypothetical protein
VDRVVVVVVRLQMHMVTKVNTVMELEQYVINVTRHYLHQHQHL